MSGLGYAVAPLAYGQMKISSVFGIVMRWTRRLGIKSSKSRPRFTFAVSDELVYRETIKRALNLPSTCVLEYKTNNGASRVVCKI